MKIGLALSGGGYRATVFHLGVLARLAKEKHLEEVTVISTVSGGSLCVGLIYALNQFQWPGSADYLERIVNKAREILSSKDLQTALILRGLLSPLKILETRADDLSALLQSHWGITIPLRELPKQPRWMINATCYETGKNWRFERFRMGDYVFGYADPADTPLSDALAASAGFPILIGPLVMQSDRYSWYRYKERAPVEDRVVDPDASLQKETILPPYRTIHLWDGGVYDNHGLEGLHDFIKGWHEDIEFFIVSDGAGRAKSEPYKLGYKALFRMVTGIMMDQVRSLRSRAILERILNHEDQGVFLQLGNTRDAIIHNTDGLTAVNSAHENHLKLADVKRAEEFPTTIRRLAPDEFEILYRHGFEVANDTLFAFYGEKFEDIPYQ